MRHPAVPQRCKMGPLEMNSTWLSLTDLHEQALSMIGAPKRAQNSVPRGNCRIVLCPAQNAVSALWGPPEKGPLQNLSDFCWEFALDSTLRTSCEWRSLLLPGAAGQALRCVP